MKQPVLQYLGIHYKFLGSCLRLLLIYCHSLVTYFQINSAVHSYNTRYLQDYHISSIRTAKRLKTLRHSGPRILNSLPTELKQEIIFTYLQNQLNPPY